MITHEIDLNVGQPNNKQFIHINQGEYDSVQIMAHIWNKNKPYSIDADKIRIEGKLSNGALLFDGDSAVQIVKENDTTVSFILTKPIAASVGSFNFSLLFYKGSDVLKKTFPFTIRVSGNPANNVKSDSVLDGVIKKLEEQECNQLATVAKTGDYNDLINKPSGLTITTNLFKPIPFINILGKKCVISVNSDNTMTVKNNSTDSQIFKIGTAHVTKGTVYKFICYSSDYENLKNTSVQINGTDYSGLDHYEYTADVSGDIDISICTNANNMGTYTIYPMLTPNLAATIDDYVPHTGIYNDINWDVSELNRGILRYPTLKLYDNDQYGGITYDGINNILSVSYINNKYPKFILRDLVAGKTEVSNLTVGDWLPIGKSDIVLKRYGTNDEGETYITDTISLYDFYTNTSKKFDEIDHSIENLYGTTELYLRKAGDSMTGALRIYVDKIQSSAATGDDPIVFAITPEQNTSLFAVTTKTMIRNGNTVFSNYQSSSNTTHINTSNIKFWNTLFAKGNNADEIIVTLPSQTGTLALVENIPTDYLHCVDGIVSDEVYFNNIVYFGDKYNYGSIEYDKDTEKLCIEYGSSSSDTHGSSSSGGLAYVKVGSIEATNGYFMDDVKLRAPVSDDDGNIISETHVSMKKIYTDLVKLQTDLGGKLSLTGGTLTGDLYTTARIFFGTEDKNIGIVANIGNTASSTPTLSFTSDGASKQPILSADGFVTANSKISDDDIIHYMTKNGKRTKISLRTMYSDLNTVVSDVEKKLPLTGGDLTGRLRIITDDFDEDENTLFSIQPLNNTARFIVNRSKSTHNGDFEFNDYQSGKNTFAVSTSNIKFWNTEFIRSESTELLNLTLPKTSGTIALISDIPKVENGTITIDQFGRQSDSFTLNQSDDLTISLVHDDSKLNVAGGVITGDLRVANELSFGSESNKCYFEYDSDNKTCAIRYDEIFDDGSASGTVSMVVCKLEASNYISTDKDVKVIEYELNDEGEVTSTNTISLKSLYKEFNDGITAEDVENEWNKIFEEVNS